MSMKLVKRKLSRRGEDLYSKFFFNSEDTLNQIIEQHDNELPIDESICDVIFNTINTTKEQIYEIIRYYPNKLKEKKHIDDKFINELYDEYSETINIMSENVGSGIRSRLCIGANYRSKVSDIQNDINSEDIKLVRECPYLHVPLEYRNSVRTSYSASLDKIDPSNGYVKGNIQVISILANQMKSSATKAELITFANSVLGMYN